MKTCLAPLLAMGFPACTAASGCPSNMQPALEIVIPGAALAADAMGGAGGRAAQYDCAAIVMVEGPIEEGEPSCNGWEDGCQCFVGTVAGTFKITVELGGATQEKTVVVEDGECGPITEQVTFDF